MMRLEGAGTGSGTPLTCPTEVIGGIKDAQSLN